MKALEADKCILRQIFVKASRVPCPQYGIGPTSVDTALRQPISGLANRPFYGVRIIMPFIATTRQRLVLAMVFKTASSVNFLPFLCPKTEPHRGTLPQTCTKIQLLLAT